jgi:hypothetical protein
VLIISRAAIQAALQPSSPIASAISDSTLRSGELHERFRHAGFWIGPRGARGGAYAESAMPRQKEGPARCRWSSSSQACDLSFAKLAAAGDALTLSERKAP